VKPVVGPGVFEAVGLGVKVAVLVAVKVGEGVSVGVSVGGTGLAVGVFDAVGVIVGVLVGAKVDVGGGAFKALQAALKSSNKRKIRRIPSFLFVPETCAVRIPQKSTGGTRWLRAEGNQ